MQPKDRTGLKVSWRLRPCGTQPESRVYGVNGTPSAAGGRDRPIKPAIAAIVSTYGNISRSCAGTFARCNVICRLLKKPKKRQAPAAPNGGHRPKMTAGREVKTRPAHT